MINCDLKSHEAVLKHHLNYLFVLKLSNFLHYSYVFYNPKNFEKTELYLKNKFVKNYVTIFRWLISQGRIDESIKILKKCERINGTLIPDHVMKEFRVSLYNQRRNNNAAQHKLLLRLIQNHVPICTGFFVLFYLIPSQRVN